MPKFLQVATLLLLCAIGISPLIIAPELAESNGFERSNGSTMGALITMTWFGAMWWISYKITRRQARRELGEDVDRLLASHRDIAAGGPTGGQRER